LELALAGDLIVASESTQFFGRLRAVGLDARLGVEPEIASSHRYGQGRRNDVSCRSYSGKQAAAMHLANFCFPDDQFEAELAALSADILSNSWYANQVNKRALIEIDGLSLHDAHALELFKNEDWRRMRRNGLRDSSRRAHRLPAEATPGYQKA